jgi:hypothetical protein
MLDQMLGYAHEQKARGGAVDRRGQQNPSFCDARGPYQTIRSTMKYCFDGFTVFMSRLDA